MLLRVVVVFFHLAPIVAFVAGLRFLALAFALLLLMPYIKVKKIEASIGEDQTAMREQLLARKARWERLTLRSLYPNTRR
jgi:hypothetical protein